MPIGSGGAFQIPYFVSTAKDPERKAATCGGEPKKEKRIEKKKKEPDLALGIAGELVKNQAQAKTTFPAWATIESG